MDRKVKVGLVQFEIVDEWAENMTRAHNILSGAAAGGAELAVLPEIFNMPYDMGLIAERAEPVPEGPDLRGTEPLGQGPGCVHRGRVHCGSGRGWAVLQHFAGVRPGRTVAWPCHRKMHLFDVDLPGGVSVKESSVLSPGNQVTVLDVLGLRLGVAICLRPEVSGTFPSDGPQGGGTGGFAGRLQQCFRAAPLGNAASGTGPRKTPCTWPGFPVCQLRTAPTRPGVIQCWWTLLLKYK